MSFDQTVLKNFTLIIISIFNLNTLIQKQPFRIECQWKVLQLDPLTHGLWPFLGAILHSCDVIMVQLKLYSLGDQHRWEPFAGSRCLQHNLHVELFII